MLSTVVINYKKMYQEKILNKIQSTINHLLQQDEKTLAVIKQSAGKIVKICLSGTEYNFHLQYNDHGFTLMQEFDGKSNVTIKATPKTFLKLLLNHNAPGTTEMEINGDVGLAQEFQQLMMDLEIDWEEELSQWTGDIAAHQIARVFKSTRNYLKETRHTIEMDISEYLRFEKELVPTTTEINEFVDQIDRLRNDVERLKLRIERISQNNRINHG